MPLFVGCSGCQLFFLQLFCNLIVFSKHFKHFLFISWALGAINNFFIPPAICYHSKFLGKLMLTLLGVAELVHLDALQVSMPLFVGCSGCQLFVLRLFCNLIVFSKYFKHFLFIRWALGAINNFLIPPAICYHFKF